MDDFKDLSLEASALDQSQYEMEEISLNPSLLSFEKTFECPNCGKAFAYKKRFINHMEVCAHKAEIKCLKQTAKVTKKPPVNNSEDKEEVWFDCNMCDEKFKLKTDLNCHLTSHSKDRPFECIECGRRFSKKIYLIRHIPTHSGGKVYTCPVCGYQVSRTDRYKLHMRSHGISDPFKCSLCGVGFPGLKELNKHLNSHNSSALDPGANTSSYQGVGLCTFNCVDCGLTFDKAEKYKQHMLKHGVDEPYECSLCGESFSSKLHLNRHLSNHNSILQASADVPTKHEDNGDDVEAQAASKFTKHSGINIHGEDAGNHHRNGKLKANTGKVKARSNSVEGVSTSRTIDPNDQLSTTEESESQNDHLYSCKSCGLRFYGKEDHREHMKTRHNKLFACLKCEKSYTRRSNLNKHSCSQNSYKCTTCEISFSSPKELDDHIITHISGLTESVDAAKEEEIRRSVNSSLLSQERSFYADQDKVIDSELPKKKKKVKHRVSPYVLEMNEDGTHVQKKKKKKKNNKVEFNDRPSSHTVQVNDYGEQYLKKKKKMKHKVSSATIDASDYERGFSKKKAKVKQKMSFDRGDVNDYDDEMPKKKTKPKPKSSSQVLEMIEYELSKFQNNLSIPTVNRREHEESALEYEKLVVYEFMSMKPVLPELDRSVHDTMYDDVKITDQISLKFFM